MMLAIEAPDELFDARVPRPLAFTHDGAALERVDGVPAGAWLAVTLESMDPTRMTGFDLALFVEACQRVANWANARMAAAIAEWSTRPDGDLVAQAVAFAVREPLQSAEKRVLAACRLKTRMPRTWRKLLSGQLPWSHAQKAAEATAGVRDQEAMNRLEESVWSRGLRNSAGEVRRAFRDTWNRLQPEQAQQRAEAARQESTDVALFDTDDGMADVVASLPVEDALLVKNTVDAAALSAKKGGDPRRIGVLRGEAMVAAFTHWLACAREVTGRSQPSGKTTSEPVPAPRLIMPGQPEPTTQPLIIAGRPTPSPEVADRSQPSEKATATRRPLTLGRRPIEIGIVIGLRSTRPGDVSVQRRTREQRPQRPLRSRTSARLAEQPHPHRRPRPGRPALAQPQNPQTHRDDRQRRRSRHLEDAPRHLPHRRPPQLLAQLARTRTVLTRRRPMRSAARLRLPGDLSERMQHPRGSFRCRSWSSTS